MVIPGGACAVGVGCLRRSRQQEKTIVVLVPVASVSALTRLHICVGSRDGTAEPQKWNASRVCERRGHAAVAIGRSRKNVVRQPAATCQARAEGLERRRDAESGVGLKLQRTPVVSWRNVRKVGERFICRLSTRPPLPVCGIVIKSSNCAYVPAETPWHPPIGRSYRRVRIMDNAVSR